jgi:hypothetical protein
MAKAQLIAQFAVDAAPSQLTSSMLIRRRRALPRMMLETIAEDEKEAAAVVELSSYYPLLRTKQALRQNLSCTAAATEAGKSSSVTVRGERCSVVVAGNHPSLSHGEELTVLA